MPKTKSTFKLHNQRMIVFMDYCIANKVKGIKSESEFLQRIGYKYVSNETQIRKGVRGFRIEHISQCCIVFGLDANFIINPAHKQMFPKEKSQSPLTQLLQAVSLVTMELSNHQSEK